MTEEQNEKKIIVDDDWKAEAQREKERLAQEEKTTAGGPMPDPTFEELINLIALQAMMGLGLMAGPGGERIPPNPEIAKHFIDMLEVLDQKTKGNLSEQEKKILDATIYEMRMRYVQLVGGAAGGFPTGQTGGPPPESPLKS